MDQSRLSVEKLENQMAGEQENYWLSVGEIAFDPFVPGKLCSRKDLAFGALTI